MFRTGRTRLISGMAALLVAGSIGVAVAASGPPPSNAMSVGHGVPEFGLTRANFRGHTVDFRYTKGFFCDTSIPAASTSGCEVGTKFNNAPARHFDPLFIAVPLGFTVAKAKMECPSGLVCVDHPGTMDLTRLESALKPLYPDLTDAQLRAALADYRTPGHQHFITTKAHGAREWWDVRIVGVTDKAEYHKITRHGSVKFLKQEVKAGRTTGVIPTNAFLFFGVN
jgi:hypothetical protein